MNIYPTLLRRECLVCIRKPHELLQPLFFFILTTTLFPLAVGSDRNTLHHIAPAGLWISLLFACLLAMDRLFKNDLADGTLSQDVLHCPDLWALILCKISVQWLLFALPLIFITPILALILNLRPELIPALMLFLLLGSLSLFLIGSIGAALTLGQNRQTFLLILIVLPLFIPVLIIGVEGSRSLLNGLSWHGHIMLLAAFLLFALLISPFFCSLAVKSQHLP